MSDEQSTPETPTEQPKKETPAGSPEGSRWEVFFPFNVDGDRTAIYVASFPPIIYFWPTIVAFFFSGIMQSVGILNPGTIGWFAILIFTLNILVIVQDFDQKKFVILCLAILLLVAGAWIIDMKGLEFLRNIFGFLLDLEPTMSTSTYILLALILSGLFARGMLRPMFDYWRLEHNEFVHYIQPFGRDMSVPRSGSTVSKDIPDVLETILTLGGGSLVIKREGEVFAKIPHIPFLGRRMKAIEKMLSEQRVTTVDD